MKKSKQELARKRETRALEAARQRDKVRQRELAKKPTIESVTISFGQEADPENIARINQWAEKLTGVRAVVFYKSAIKLQNPQANTANKAKGKFGSLEGITVTTQKKDAPINSFN